MTPTQFRTIGEALYGPSWQRALARDLKRDERTIRHYAAETRPVPTSLHKPILALLYAHREKLGALAKSITL
jgi:hypothetical protein